MNSRDFPLVHRGVLSVPRALGSHLLCSQRGGGVGGGDRQTDRQSDKQGRQTGQRGPHLQEPASSTSVWGTDAREGEMGGAGAGREGEGRGGGKTERVTSNTLNAGTPALPRPPALDYLSFRPSTVRASPRAARGPPPRRALQALLCGLPPAPSSPAAAGLSGGREGSALRWRAIPAPPTLARPRLPCPPRKGACAPGWPGPRGWAASLSTPRRRQP